MINIDFSSIRSQQKRGGRRDPFPLRHGSNSGQNSPYSLAARSRSLTPQRNQQVDSSTEVTEFPSDTPHPRPTGASFGTLIENTTSPKLRIDRHSRSSSVSACSETNYLEITKDVEDNFRRQKKAFGTSPEGDVEVHVPSHAQTPRRSQFLKGRRTRLGGPLSKCAAKAEACEAGYVSDESQSTTPSGARLHAQSPHTDQGNTASRDRVGSCHAMPTGAPIVPNPQGSHMVFQSLPPNFDGMAGMQPGNMYGMQPGSTVGMQYATIGCVQQGNMAGMPYGSMTGMQPGNMVGMQHGNMAGMQQGSLGGMQQGSIASMQQGSLSGVQHGSLSGVQQGSIAGMQQTSMSGTQQGGMNGLQQGSMNSMQRGTNMAAMQHASMAGVQQAVMMQPVMMGQMNQQPMMVVQMPQMPDSARPANAMYGANNVQSVPCNQVVFMPVETGEDPLKNDVPHAFPQSPNRVYPRGTQYPDQPREDERQCDSMPMRGDENDTQRCDDQRFSSLSRLNKSLTTPLRGTERPSSDTTHVAAPCGIPPPSSIPLRAEVETRRTFDKCLSSHDLRGTPCQPPERPDASRPERPRTSHDLRAGATTSPETGSRAFSPLPRLAEEDRGARDGRSGHGSSMPSQRDDHYRQHPSLSPARDGRPRHGPSRVPPARDDHYRHDRSLSPTRDDRGRHGPSKVPPARDDHYRHDRSLSPTRDDRAQHGPSKLPPARDDHYRHDTSKLSPPRREHYGTGPSMPSPSDRRDQSARTSAPKAQHQDDNTRMSYPPSFAPIPSTRTSNDKARDRLDDKQGYKERSFEAADHSRVPMSTRPRSPPHGRSPPLARDRDNPPHGTMDSYGRTPRDNGLTSNYERLTPSTGSAHLPLPNSSLDNYAHRPPSVPQNTSLSATPGCAHPSTRHPSYGEATGNSISEGRGHSSLDSSYPRAMSPTSGRVTSDRSYAVASSYPYNSARSDPVRPDRSAPPVHDRSMEYTTRDHARGSNPHQDACSRHAPPTDRPPSSSALTPRSAPKPLSYSTSDGPLIGSRPPSAASRAPPLYSYSMPLHDQNYPSQSLPSRTQPTLDATYERSPPPPPPPPPHAPTTSLPVTPPSRRNSPPEPAHHHASRYMQSPPTASPYPSGPGTPSYTQPYLTTMPPNHIAAVPRPLVNTHGVNRGNAEQPPVDLIVDVSTTQFEANAAFDHALFTLDRCTATIQIVVKFEGKLVGNGSTQVDFVEPRPFSTEAFVKVSMKANEKIMLTLAQPVDVDRVVMHCRGKASSTTVCSNDSVHYADEFGVLRQKRREGVFNYDMTIQATGEVQPHKKRDAVWLLVDFLIEGDLRCGM